MDKERKANLPFDVKKLSLVVVIVDHNQSDVFVDSFMTLEANVQLTLLASGTVKKEIKNLLGLSDPKKDVLFTIMKDERLDEAFSYIETRFKISPKHKGIAFSVKMTSVVGISVYKILSNTLELKPNGGK